MLQVAVIAASLLVQSPTDPRTVQLPRAGEEAVFAAGLFAAQRSFMDDWRLAWAKSESSRRIAELKKRGSEDTPFAPKYNPRQADSGCDFWVGATSEEMMYAPDASWGRDPLARAIASRTNNHFWVCPNWHPPDGPTFPPAIPGDERVWIDAAIEPQFRASIRAQRRELLVSAAHGVARFPSNGAMIGQYVRLLLDQRESEDALAAARACEAERWWCFALEGYVLHQQGSVARADETFRASVSAMPDSTRCAWSELTPLLDGEPRYSYSRMSCAARAAADSAIWWMADVLWSEAGNDRRTEHFARRVTIALRAASGWDERYNWHPEGGGDALAEMVMRYGWHTYAYGILAGRVRFPPPKPPVYGYVQLYKPAPRTPPIRTPGREARALQGITTTHEYRMARLRVLPPWSVLRDPFNAEYATWDMHAPESLEGALKWWPREHYQPLRPFFRMFEKQSAYLRRDNESLLAFAANLSQADLGRHAEDTVGANLVVSTGPSSMDVVGRTRARPIDRATFLAPLPQARAVVSMEVPWDSTGHGAHLRFGVHAPPPLTAMAPDAVAMSDPILLVVPPELDALPFDADSAVKLMRGTTSMPSSTRAIGVYWETYGVRATDSVDVAITIRRRAEGIVERLGVAIGVRERLEPLVALTWKEPTPERAPRTVDGRVPIQMRSISLDIATLGPGAYELEVSVRRARGDTMRGTREFVLR